MSPSNCFWHKSIVSSQTLNQSNTGLSFLVAAAAPPPPPSPNPPVFEVSAAAFVFQLSAVATPLILLSPLPKISHPGYTSAFCSTSTPCLLSSPPPMPPPSLFRRAKSEFAFFFFFCHRFTFVLANPPLQHHHPTAPSLSICWYVAHH